tara:strand:- start:8681 stop:9625 length:945 start_codon:yes stop_codon:yes gene_type:complete
MLKSFSNYKKILIIGIGGGADIVGTIPTKLYFESYGVKCILGGLPWERYSIDPFPGPRPFSQIVNKTKINDSLCWASGKTKTKDGLFFSESKVSKVLKEKILLINIFNDSKKIAKDLEFFCERNKIDMIIGVDVGGDVIAQGKEKGLSSPLADSIMLSTLRRIEKRIPTKIGVLGYGSDGELEASELNESLSLISQKKGLIGMAGISVQANKLMKKIITKVETDASRIPTLAFDGMYGLTKIRRGRIQIDVHPFSQVTVYMKTSIIFKHVSSSARLIHNSSDIWESNSILLDKKFKTELDFEIKKHLISLEDTK